MIELLPRVFADASWTLAQAQAEDLDRVGQIIHSWSSHELAAPGWLIALLVALLLGVLLVMWLRNRDRSRQRVAPMNLFRQAAGHVGLGLSEQTLLIRIARHEQLPSALVLMLSPDTLTHHARRYVESMPPGRRASISRKVQAIGEFLFD